MARFVPCAIHWPAFSLLCLCLKPRVLEKKPISMSWYVTLFDSEVLWIVLFVTGQSASVVSFRFNGPQLSTFFAVAHRTEGWDDSVSLVTHMLMLSFVAPSDVRGIALRFISFNFTAIQSPYHKLLHERWFQLLLWSGVSKHDKLSPSASAWCIWQSTQCCSAD
ncbi:hypothetical protein EJ08DRAFT_495854 [Tothia fuscella]|uniref:Secreted protein n=1 Tax=Tothia fuscella TaxID=1048955 RepID=A0A9P4NZX7_9PEZI|nr:hypothetical protein EJ08DRAFT_495854 [Tothia fuscella]